MAEELARLHWSPEDLLSRPKSHPLKLALAARLRRETPLLVTESAERLHLGKDSGETTLCPREVKGDAIFERKDRVKEMTLSLTDTVWVFLHALAHPPGTMPPGAR